LNWLSLILVAVIGLLAWAGYRNGFVRELISLCALILAIPLAGVFYDDMVPKVEPIVDSGLLAALISFLAILAGVIVAGQVAAHLTRQVVAMLNLGTLDEFAGGVFGFLKAVVLCQVVLVALVTFPKPDLRDDIDHSAVAGWLLDSAPAVLAILPGSFDRATDLFLEGTGEIDDAISGEGQVPAP
jgi:membrane protein required for colicin V production